MQLNLSCVCVCCGRSRPFESYLVSEYWQRKAFKDDSYGFLLIHLVGGNDGWT